MRRKIAPILLGLVAVGGISIAAGLFASANAQTPLPPDRQPVLAPIESIEMVPSGAAPTGHALKVRAGLPGGCVEPLDSGYTRSGDAIFAYVTNSAPVDPNAVCTQEYGTYEAIIDLGTDFVPGKVYTAYVNGTEHRFIAQGGIVPPAKVEAPAPIESVNVTATASMPSQQIVQVMAGLPGSCSEPANHTVTREGSLIRVEVTNFEPAAGTVCAPVYSTYPVSINLGSDFTTGEVYEIAVNDVDTTFTAY